MHILYLSFGGGGLDTNVRVLAPALVRTGHRVSVLYVHPPGTWSNGHQTENDCYTVYHAESSGWHYYASRLSFQRTRLPRLVRAWDEARALGATVRKIRRTEGLDLVELPEVFITPRQMEGIPFVVRLHSADWTWRRMLNEPIDSADRLETRMEAYTLHRSSGISSPSRMLADYVRQTCQLDRPISIIPYPVDTERFTPGAGPIEPPVVLFVGRIESRKGADVLMRAIPKVVKERPDCEFVFAGRVSDDMRMQVREMPERVQFLGIQPRDALVALYQRAAVLVVPSWWDNSPNTIYEAMACGTPVVSTRVGGIPELVDDGATGLLVPLGDERALGDAILDLLNDPARREQMRRRAREKAVAEFAVEKIGPATISFYRSVLSAGLS